MTKNPSETLLIGAPREELCLAYANTLSWRGRTSPAESLSGYPDLLAWLRREAALPAELLLAAHEEAARHPVRSATVFAEAIALREAIYRVVSTVASGRKAAPDDLVPLNDALRQAPPRARLAGSGEGYGWNVGGLAPTLPALLAPVLWSAGDLLARSDFTRLRRCANDACLWLFIDQSKAGTRRWCDMSSCGNRAKAQRHYRKTKQP